MTIPNQNNSQGNFPADTNNNANGESDMDDFDDMDAMDDIDDINNINEDNNNNDIGHINRTNNTNERNEGNNTVDSDETDDIDEDDNDEDNYIRDNINNITIYKLSIAMSAMYLAARKFNKRMPKFKEGCLLQLHEECRENQEFYEQMGLALLLDAEEIERSRLAELNH